ncbi:MAG: Trm112 family protein [Burkholderiales bacterium]|nr:MAG: Trm112 family protein [Burkholderiales bacterium]
MDHRLIELLVCPICKGPLQMLRNDEGVGVELMCRADRLAFPIRDGIPVMLEAEARTVEAAPPPASPLAANP